MSSPLHGRYPGTAVMVLLVFLCLFMIYKYALETYKVRRGIIDRQGNIEEWRIGLVWIIFLIFNLISIWFHYHNKNFKDPKEEINHQELE